MHVTKFFYNSFLEHLVSSYTDAHKILHPSNYSYLNFLSVYISFRDQNSVLGGILWHKGLYC